MQRYFVSDDATDFRDRIVIMGDDYHHIVHVMRMPVGTRVEIGHNGKIYIAEIDEITLDHVDLHVAEKLQTQDIAFQLTLYQGLPKGEKIDLILRQACEIGVTRIVIFEADHSVARLSSDKREGRLVRWRKIAKEAAEQAKRTRVPDVHFVSSLEIALATDNSSLLLVPYELQGHALPSIRDVLAAQLPVLLPSHENQPLSISFVIGPEGGFSLREIEWFSQQRVGHLLTLGARILRTETAGIVVATIILYELNQMGVT